MDRAEMPENRTESEPKGMMRFFRYVLVGSSTFLADYGLLYALKRLGASTVLASGAGFSVGIFCNFLLTKYFAFRSARPRARGGGEVLAFGLVTAVGLGLTMLLMHLFTDRAGLSVLLAKPAAGIIVFLWNFAARHYLLYPEISER